MSQMSCVGLGWWLRQNLHKLTKISFILDSQKWGSGGMKRLQVTLFRCLCFIFYIWIIDFVVQYFYFWSLNILRRDELYWFSLLLSFTIVIFIGWAACCGCIGIIIIITGFIIDRCRAACTWGSPLQDGFANSARKRSRKFQIEQNFHWFSQFCRYLKHPKLN